MTTNNQETIEKLNEEAKVSASTIETAEAGNFDENLVTKYPRSRQKLSMSIDSYKINIDSPPEGTIQQVHISPHGLKFETTNDFDDGDLLKIHVELPNFWGRKQNLVDYGRVDNPNSMKILAKVVKSENIGKRGKKKKVLVQTVNMDSIDEEVLKRYLKGEK